MNGVCTWGAATLFSRIGCVVRRLGAVDAAALGTRGV